MIPLGHYLIVSAILFAIGTAGVFLRRNLITILLSIEIMLNAVNLTFVAFGRSQGTVDGQIITFFVMTVAAAEAAVGLAIVIGLFRHRESLNPDAFTLAEVVMIALIPLFPLLGFVVNASLGTASAEDGLGRARVARDAGVVCRIGRRSCGSWRASRRRSASSSRRSTRGSRRATSSLDLTFRVDPLSAVMILVITGIGSLIHIYSTAYMHDERDGEYARYFSYLNLFAAFMLVLVLGANFLVLFVGWEGVGLCSYLLIGFWFEKKSAADAGKKAFVVNRIGDYAFILGTLLVFVRFGTLDFQRLASAVAPLGARVDVRHAVAGDAAAVHRRDRASRRRFRSTSGCPTRWRARRRSRP